MASVLVMRCSAAVAGGVAVGLAAGTLIGGPIGDRFGRKPVIWVSILGVLPFSLMLPYANLFWTSILTVIIGMTVLLCFRWAEPKMSAIIWKRHGS